MQAFFCNIFVTNLRFYSDGGFLYYDYLIFPADIVLISLYESNQIESILESVL